VDESILIAGKESARLVSGIRDGTGADDGLLTVRPHCATSQKAAGSVPDGVFKFN
jgi:hypothetical protein